MNATLTGLLRTGLMIAGSVAFSVAQADTIVNIKGYGNDGAGANIYAYPVAPGTLLSATTLFNPVEITLAAGDYILTDAWGKSGALYDAWNFQVGAAGSWGTHYLVAEDLRSSGGGYKVLLEYGALGDPSCTYHYCAWATETAASTAFLNSPPATLHLGKTTTLAFVSADYYLPDNAGGISLNVAAVPEPETYALMMAGLGLMGFMVRRKK
jgi:hypothetical protein